MSVVNKREPGKRVSQAHYSRATRLEFQQKTREILSDKTKGLFAAAKLPRDVFTPESGVNPYSSSSLTRVLTGDVPAKYITGLGRMAQKRFHPGLKKEISVKRLSPMEYSEDRYVYKDVFVSSIEEIANRYFPSEDSSIETPDKFSKTLTGKGKLDPERIARSLNLKDEDVEKINKQGIWLITIHPGTAHAVPTQRRSEWNPHNIEGGRTVDGQREWVTPNVDLLKAMKERSVKLYKIAPDHSVTEWKVFQQTLYPEDVHMEKIQEHIASQQKE